MPRPTAVAAPPIDPKEELRRLLWALLVRRLQVNMRAKLPNTDGISLTIPAHEIPVRDNRGVKIGSVVSWEMIAGETYVEMLLDPEMPAVRAISKIEVSLAGHLSHVEIRGRA
jgi:hypothetical protein